ncbi:hypothetical protein DYB25_008098 [Aphanomyces astaci]|uniref:Proline-rich protein PRCC n=1 Tax=Aphanomyces astaci TaxID=112090 RepID=A0A397BUR1_APHAT|nr:hypothetical protein DYB25_008098 [Aphanomyces astaci]RHZ06614.1 hypothetical protein DYB26_010641 [Aphanomyces astaci]
MSLVADYGSDSDSDGSPVVPKTAAPATPAQQASDAPLTRGPAISIFPDKPPVKSSIPHKPTSSAGPPKKKAKKTLHLPPEIQKLLESGRALNSDDDSDTDTKKQPAAMRKQSTATKPPTDALLSFLPPPKVALPVLLASMAGTETEGGYVIASYKPSRLQRQRHQLNQLTFDAKLREFDLMDSKSQMVKSKKETQAKYGW